MKNNSLKSVFLLGITSDIGKALAALYLKEGYAVFGTCRDTKAGNKFEVETGISVMSCDVENKDSIKKAVDKFVQLYGNWDIFISAVGTSEPLGHFFTCDFDSWERSLLINSTGQLRVLHALFPYRCPESISHVVFFAGGGTNNAFPNFSAYCVSKIMLIKMCELLDDENEDLNVFIVGPGWVKTKIHNQVLNNPEGAGESYKKVRQFLDSGEEGTSNESIYECINWCVEQGREVVGGRNFSVVHDSWEDGGKELVDQLRENPDKFKLRRSGNEKI